MIEDGNKKIIAEDNDQEEKGSHFAIGDEYVDYIISPESGDKVTDLTKDLLERKFLKHDREIQMN